MLVPKNQIEMTEAPVNPRSIAIFGSTGSIGVSTLEIVRGHSGCFNLYALVAGGNCELLAEQAKEFRPKVVAIKDASKVSRLKSLLGSNESRIEVLSGEDEIASLAGSSGYEVAVAAIVGMAGLSSTLAAARAGKTIALANKESVVAAGELVSKVARESGARILPVDSEHSAIFQVLQGEAARDIKSITLTASGGPFLHTPLGELSSVSPAQAIKHPRWAMGPKVSVDSATMFNKAHELIEAHWLFGVAPQSINVCVHPQSIVHSLVEFLDSTQLAQLSLPDMKGPIAYALNYPYGRLSNVMREFNLASMGRLDFMPLDGVKFPAVDLARQAILSGGAASAVFTMANEVAVGEFLGGRLRFDLISGFVSEALERYASVTYADIEDLRHLQERLSRELTQDSRKSVVGAL